MALEPLVLAARVERDGFAVVADVLGPETVAELIGAVDRERGGPGVLRRGADVYGMRDLLRRVVEVRRLARSAALRALVEPVLGPGAFVVRGLWFDKTPGANWNLPWHRDLTIAVRRRRDVPGFGPWTVKAGIPHVQPPAAVLRRMLAVRLHLDVCDEDNGPLAVLPGSHAVGDADVRDPGPWPARVPAVTCLVPRGGAVLMRPLLLHASSTARAPGHRRVVHLEFAAGPLPGGLEWFEAAEDAP
jgi:ectoine hydroxylase-related dioxygenase (phytanoyl-CoA dioxygenase family)